MSPKKLNFNAQILNFSDIQKLITLSRVFVFAFAEMSNFTISKYPISQAKWRGVRWSYLYKK